MTRRERERAELARRPILPGLPGGEPYVSRAEVYAAASDWLTDVVVANEKHFGMEPDYRPPGTRLIRPSDLQ